jgi:hypothetical protein
VIAEAMAAQAIHDGSRLLLWFLSLIRCGDMLRCSSRELTA